MTEAQRHPVSDGRYIRIDRRMSELKHRLSDPRGSLISPAVVEATLIALIEGEPAADYADLAIKLPASLTARTTLKQLAGTVTDPAISTLLTCLVQHAWLTYLSDFKYIPPADVKALMGPGSYAILERLLKLVHVSMLSPTVDRSSWPSLGSTGSLGPMPIPRKRLLEMSIEEVARKASFYHASLLVSPNLTQLLANEDIGLLGQLVNLPNGDLTAHLVAHGYRAPISFIDNLNRFLKLLGLSERLK